MRRRSNDLVDSSLDLLLDTVTNAFGGIVFLSILIVLLLRTSSDQAPTEIQSADQPSQAEMLRTQTALERASNDLTQLQAVAAVQSSLGEALKNEVMAKRYEDLQQLKDQRNKVAAVRVKDVTRLAQLQNANNKTRDSIAETTRTLDEQRKRLVEIKEQLAKETDERTQSANLPQAKTTSKTEVQAVVRYGRVYFVYSYHEGGARQGFSSSDFLILDDNLLRVHMTPKPYAGIPLSDKDQAKALLRTKLTSLSAAEHYLGLAVWHDSFEDFLVLKKIMIDLGYEYRLIAIDEKGAVVSSHVKDPRVQ